MVSRNKRFLKKLIIFGKDNRTVCGNRNLSRNFFLVYKSVYTYSSLKWDIANVANFNSIVIFVEESFCYDEMRRGRRSDFWCLRDVWIFIRGGILVVVSIRLCDFFNIIDLFVEISWIGNKTFWRILTSF